MKKLKWPYSPRIFLILLLILALFTQSMLQANCNRKDEPNCANCDATGETCLECSSSYTLVNNKCVSCPDGCDKCYPTNMTCYQCLQHHTQQDLTCQKCSKNCKECSSTINTCTECYFFDKLDSSSSSCKLQVELIVIVGASVLGLLIVFLAICCWCKLKNRKKALDPQVLDEQLIREEEAKAMANPNRSLKYKSNMKSISEVEPGLVRKDDSVISERSDLETILLAVSGQNSKIGSTLVQTRKSRILQDV